MQYYWSSNHFLNDLMTFFNILFKISCEVIKKEVTLQLENGRALESWFLSCGCLLF